MQQEIVNLVKFKAIAGSLSELTEDGRGEFELAVPQPIYINYNTLMDSCGEVTYAKVLEDGNLYVEGVVEEPLLGIYIGCSMHLTEGYITPLPYGAFLRHVDACATVMEAI